MQHWNNGCPEVKRNLFFYIGKVGNYVSLTTQDGVVVAANEAPPTIVAKKRRIKRPLTAREQFNTSYALFKQMATTMSQLTAADFNEKFQLLLDIHDLMKMNQPITLSVTGKYNSSRCTI